MDVQIGKYKMGDFGLKLLGSFDYELSAFRDCDKLRISGAKVLQKGWLLWLIR